MLDLMPAFPSLRPRARHHQLRAILAVVLVVALPSVAASELVLRDGAWPSVGPGSDGSLARPELVEIDVADDATAVVLPRSSLPPTVPAAGARGVPRTPPTTLGFGGVDGTNKDGTLHKPPDTHMAVGTGAGALGRVVMVTNSGLQIWDKTGTALVAAIGLDAFLGTPVPSGFDPKVLFDQHSGRFFIVVLEGKTPNPGGTSNVHIAVSTTSTPSNLTTDWTKLSGNALTNVGGIETFFDYPSLGADAGSLFVSGNLFASNGFFVGTKIRVFDKAALLAGSYAFVDLDIDDSATPGSFTLQPAHVYGATDSGNFYFVNRVGPTLYRVWEIAGAPAAPVIVANAPRFWAAGNPISGATQAGTPVVLDTVSGRVMNAVYRDGHIWLTLTADVDSDQKAEVFWAKLATNGGAPAAPAIADVGYLDGSDGVEWAFMPSINVNAAGAVTIGYTQSFGDQFPEMRYASRAATDPAGFFQASAVAATSPGFYDAFFPTILERWGDYSATVVDPDDDLTFWTANEITLTSGVDTSIWNTFIARLGPVVADPNPPTPTPTPPAPTPVAVEAGGLVFTGEVHAHASDSPGLFRPTMVEVSSDGAHLYAVGNFFSIYFRDAITGTLTFATTQAVIVGGNVPDWTALESSPSGQHLYVGGPFPGIGSEDGGIVVLERDPVVGFLSALQVFTMPDAFRRIEDLELSADGAHLYVVDANFGRAGGIIVLARNGSNGQLSLVQTLDLVEMDRELRRGERLAISPDGAHVYYTGTSNDYVAIFSRNATTGELALVDRIVQGVDGADALSGVGRVVVTPDGAHVLTASTRTPYVGVYARDAGTGALAFIEILKGGPLKDVSDVVASADGRHVYVAGSDGSVIVYLRHAATGRLAFLGKHEEGVAGVGGLGDTRTLVESPDGAQVYTVGRGEADATFGTTDVSTGTVVKFIRDACGSGLLTGNEQCDDGDVTGGDGCSATCALELCGPTPSAGCRTPLEARGALLALKAKGTLLWKWNKGQQTTVADFGDPTTSASYLLCVYDSSIAPQPLRAFAAPAGGTCAGKPCWAPSGTTGFKYGDKAFTPDGLFKAKSKAGADGKAKLLFKGKGALLDLPSLPLTSPVTVQLHHTDGSACWTATYSTPITNAPDKYKAKSD